MKKQITIIIASILILTIISLSIKFLASFTYLDSFRIVFGSVYVLFIPGFIISYIFFKAKSIDIIERIALSFALSIAIVPLTVFYLNLIGIKINMINSFLTVLAIIIISAIILFIKNKRTLS